MKRVIGIFMVIMICIALGISVGRFRDRDVSLVSLEICSDLKIPYADAAQDRMEVQSAIFQRRI